MKAVRLHAYGGAEVLRYEEAPQPTPGPGQALVRVRAAGVNPVDWKTRAGRLQAAFNHPLPLTLGADVAGTVEALGAGVADFAVGDAVYGYTGLGPLGCYAEYVAVEATSLAPKPAALTFAEAASLPLAVLTAWQGFDLAGLAPGQRVLIHAAAGGVGSLAVQLARALGAAYVVGTASARNHELVRQLGADAVIDYQAQFFESAVAPVDLVFDAVGGEVRNRSFAALKPGGFLVSIVGAPSAELAAQHGVRVGSFLVQPDGARLRRVNDLLAAGQLRPLVETELPLAEAARAHELIETGHTRGKIVLTVPG